MTKNARFKQGKTLFASTVRGDGRVRNFHHEL
jgi:hypothetical protein